MRHRSTYDHVSRISAVLVTVCWACAADTGEPYRTWKSTKGTTVEARLVQDAAATVILQKRTGQKVSIKRQALSPEDRQYLGKIRVQSEAQAPAEEVAYAPPRQVCVVMDERITEASGLACSRHMPDAFWTHNDSGDTPRLFLVNTEGKLLTSQTIAQARARDWEDMASFKLKNQGYLLIGDVGDNEAKREECQLYLVKEPRINPIKRQDGTLKVEMTIRFQYEDGPHNCESLGVDVTARNIYLVSKQGKGECRVYEMPLPLKPSPKRLTAKAIAVLDIPTTTAMDISPDGRRAVVLTYGNAYEYTRGARESWAEGFARKPRILDMPHRKQGEAISYGQSGQALYLVSEGLCQPLWEVPAVMGKR